MPSRLEPTDLDLGFPQQNLAVSHWTHKPRADYATRQVRYKAADLVSATISWWERDFRSLTNLIWLEPARYIRANLLGTARLLLAFRGLRAKSMETSATSWAGFLKFGGSSTPVQTGNIQRYTGVNSQHWIISVIFWSISWSREQKPSGVSSTSMIRYTQS